MSSFISPDVKPVKKSQKTIPPALDQDMVHAGVEQRGYDR
jgi:hypothetical protein